MVALRCLKNTYSSRSGHFLFTYTEFLGGSGGFGTYHRENLSIAQVDINKKVGAFWGVEKTHSKH